MNRFVLVFDPDDVASNKGSAWVGVEAQIGGPKKLPVVTHDCGSPKEFEIAIRQLQAELDHILQSGQKKFAEHWKAKMSARDDDQMFAQ